MSEKRMLKICTWNANGLLQKLDELEIFMREKDIDICLVSETHVKKQSHETHVQNESHLKIKGYNDFHACHPSGKARGGSSLYIKDYIEQSENLKIELETLQLCTIRVKISQRTLKISSIYCPPRSVIEKSDFTNLFESLKPNFIIGGDFNAKHTFWGSRYISQKGRMLYGAGMEYSCDFHSTGKPTYWPTDPTKIPDLIDFFVVKGISNNRIKVEESFDLSSDHSPVILKLSEKLVYNLEPARLTGKTTNWEGFRNETEENIVLSAPLTTPYELEIEVDRFVEIVQIASWNNTPKPRKTPDKYGLRYPPEIKDLVKERRKARKKWQQSRAPQHKAHLNQLSNLLKKTIKDFKNRAIGSYLESLTAKKDSNYSLWKAVKGTKRPKISAPPIKINQNEWAREDKEKADVFAAHLEQTFKPYDGQEVYDGSNRLELPSDDLILASATLRELKQVIENLKPKKAPGYDLITGEILKALPRKALIKLLHILNAALRLKHVPSQWKVAEVIMVLKPGKPPNEVKSYRPISLLPVISKIFERILLRRLQPVLEGNNLIPDHQFGFRSKHSTIDQVHRITDVIEKALEERKICSSVFLDVSQAFDKVWHDGLKYKLRQVLPVCLYDILESYLGNRLFRVRHGNEYSELKEISAGVPQGSVLGPLLYLLYTRDIPREDGTTLATFADDTAILAVGKTIEETTAKLQNALNKVNQWTRDWRIALNETKSVHVNFTYKKINDLPIFLNLARIPFANEAKYLGMTLDAKLKWNSHVKMKRKELEIKYREMYWLLGKHSQLSTENKLLLYKQVLKPVWTYGIQLWGCTKKTNANIIQTFQNKVLREIVQAPWYSRNDDIHRDLGIPTIEAETRSFAQKHRNRLIGHVNNTVLQLLDESNLLRRLQRTKPFDLAR